VDQLHPLFFFNKFSSHFQRPVVTILRKESTTEHILYISQYKLISLAWLTKTT